MISGGSIASALAKKIDTDIILTSNPVEKDSWLKKVFELSQVKNPEYMSKWQTINAKAGVYKKNSNYRGDSTREIIKKPFRPDLPYDCFKYKDKLFTVLTYQGTQTIIETPGKIKYQDLVVHWVCTQVEDHVRKLIESEAL